MTNYKHCCVIDANYLYKGLVLALLTQADQGQGQEWQVQNYTLAQGEQLVDAAPPALRPYAGAAGFVSPRWDAWTSSWAEAATEEEISAWETEHPDPYAKTLPQAKDQRQAENKAALAQWLRDHPLTWSDGKQYGVEEQDQNEMALNLMQYQAAQQAGQTAPLEWHAKKEACREFTQEEYLGLSMAISAYVYPYRRYQESVKEDIYAAETLEEVAAVVIDYAGVVHD